MTKITIRPKPGTSVVRAGGAVIAESAAALELLEEGYPPVTYFPRADAMAFCDPSDKRTQCPHKGEASYFHVTTKSGPLKDAAWSYEDPIEAVAEIAGCIAFAHEKVTVETL